MPDEIVYLNHQYIKLQDAKISVLDRGFLFADAIYEVIPIYGGRLFRLEAHLERLKMGLDGIRMKNPKTDAEWNALFEQLIQRHPSHPAQYIYLQISRGAPEHRDHAIPKALEPTIFAMLNKIQPRSPELAKKGVSAITLEDKRWQYCHLKTTCLLANILARSEAVDHLATEAILFKDHQITEGAASNIFIVKNKQIQTPPKSHQILSGITRDLVIELIQQSPYSVIEENISLDALFNADEVWMTSSTKEILPITQIDEKPIGIGQVGKVWQDLNNLYQNKLQQLING